MRAPSPIPGCDLGAPLCMFGDGIRLNHIKDDRNA